MRSLPRPVDIAAPADAVSPVVSPISGADRVARAERRAIIVDVAGWVRQPGVYEFASGDRVIDAIEPRRRPAEGRRPHHVEPRGAARRTARRSSSRSPAATTTGGPGSSGDASTSGGTTLININTASETELEELPGVGPVTAAAIIDYRTQNGPFATVDDLIDVSGIGPSTLEQIRPFATV